MSIKAMSWVWESGPADQAECFVLLALADFANDDGECWPSVPGIAAKVRMKERGVRQIIRRLEAGGWLKTEIAAARAGANHYRIIRREPGTTCPAPPAPHAPGTARPRHDMPPASDDTYPGTTCPTPRHETALTPAPHAPEPSLTTIEPSGTVTDSARDEFEEIWKRYPRRVGKGAAEKAWRSARKSVSLEAIAAPLSAFVAAVQGGEQRFIPHLATWLNQRRWEDDPGHAANRPRTSADDLNHLSAIRSTDDLASLMPPQLRIAR